VRADDVRDTVEKLSTRAITLLQTSYQSKVYTQSYGAPKSWESQPWQKMGVLGQNAIWMWAPWAATEYTIKGKVVISPKSSPW